MATTLYFNYTYYTAPTVSQRVVTGDWYTHLYGGTTAWYAQVLSTSRGSTASTSSRGSAVGPTPGVEAGIYAGSPLLWISQPLSADLTVSGSITFNMRAYESSMSANMAINCRILKMVATTNAVSEVYKTVRSTELGTSEAANNWSETPGSSFSFNRGDRIVLAAFFDDGGGNQSSGYTGYFYFNGPTAAASGDSYVTFTETFSFESEPAGTTVYPTGTSAGIDPGSATELEAWTSRGGGVETAVTDTANGPISAKQVTTDTTSDTLVEWYTKPLEAVTLSGAVLVNARVAESSTAANSTLRCEIAICDIDGSNPVAWGMGGAGTDTTNNNYIELTTSQVAAQFWVSGDDLSITHGQRIRIRFFIDDVFGHYTSTIYNMASGYSVTVYYAGSAGATGDTYLTFPITLTEHEVSGGGDDLMPYFGGGYYPS